MLSPRRFVLGCGATLVVLLCSTTASQAFPASAIANVEVDPPPNPASLNLRDGNMESVVALGDGTADAAADASGTDSSLSRLHVGDELARATAVALKQKGLNPTPASSAQPSQAAKVVFVIEEVGYERRVWGKIGPKLTVRVRLLDATSGGRLWADTYKYDRAAMTIGSTMLRPPEQYVFDRLEDVTAHPETVTGGLRAGIQMIAERAAADLVEEIDK